MLCWYLIKAAVPTTHVIFPIRNTLRLIFVITLVIFERKNYFGFFPIALKVWTGLLSSFVWDNTHVHIQIPSCALIRHNGEWTIAFVVIVFSQLRSLCLLFELNVHWIFSQLPGHSVSKFIIERLNCLRYVQNKLRKSLFY